MEINWSVIAISFVITWLFALSVPLTARYVIVRKPLRRKTATIIAVTWSIIGWIAFRIVNSAVGETSGEPPSTGAVWVVVFFVARWIMSRGSDEPKPERRPFNLRQALIGMPTFDDPPKKTKLSNAEIVAELNRMIEDPETSEERRIWATERLKHFQLRIE